jgi:hypothetical protein
MPAEVRRRDLRLGLVCHELVEDALLALSEIRAAAAERGWPGGDLRYYSCVALAQRALQVFDWDEIDYFVSVVQERMKLGVWGLSLPVGQRTHSKHHERPRSINEKTVSSAIEVLALRLDAARRHDREATDAEVAAILGCKPATVRKRVSRALELCGPIEPRQKRWTQGSIDLAERARLDADVAAGRMLRWVDDVDAHKRLEELGWSREEILKFSDDIYVSTSPGPRSGEGLAAHGRVSFGGTGATAEDDSSGRGNTRTS